MILKLFVVTGLALGLAACAPPFYWTKPGATQEEFQLTEYNCDRDSLQAYPHDDDVFLRGRLYDKCMAAHGWAKMYKTQ